VLDDGRITDGQGRTVNFKNTIIILTSNIGSQAIVEAGGDATKQDEVRLRVLDLLRSTYRPEFLNRLDELVLFNPLQKLQLRKIAKLTLGALTSRLRLKELTLDVSESALDVLTDLGYSPEYGARPLKRVVQKELETPIARGLISGEFVEGDTVSVRADMDATKLVIESANRRATHGTAEGTAEGPGSPPSPAQTAEVVMATTPKAKVEVNGGQSEPASSSLPTPRELPPPPSEWVEVTAEDGRVYFWNQRTDETSWSPNMGKTGPDAEAA